MAIDRSQVRRRDLHDPEADRRELRYWLSRSVEERIAHVEHLRAMMHGPEYRFVELIESFDAAGVEYLIVGGYAMAAHGRPRYTANFDVFVRPTSENAHRVISALRAFGFGSVGLDAADFEQPGRVVQLGYEPWRIDILTRLDGVSWEEAVRDVKHVRWGGQSPVIGLTALIQNKLASGRPQDLVDAATLRALQDADGAGSGQPSE